MLDVTDLRFSYDGRAVLRGVCLHVPRGSLCGLFGPNGSGKTTLFRCCLGLLDASGGTIRLEGEDLRTLGTAALARRVAYVPQDHKPAFSFLAREVVLMGRTPHLNGGLRIEPREWEAAEAALDTVGLAAAAGEPYNRLSHGQRQLVLIARALAQQTRCMFLDEPTSALDFQNQVRIWRTLRRLCDEGLSVVACSHDPNHIAWYCDRVVVLRSGETIAEGSPEQVLTPQLLDAVYPGACQVTQLEGVPLVLPGTIRPPAR